MKDCRLTITVRNDDIRCEMENISMVELATLSTGSSSSSASCERVGSVPQSFM